MKNAKFILLIILFFFINSTAFAQSITVDDPHSGDVWYKTKPCTIRWTKSGSMDAKVKIRLFNSAGTVRIMNITNSTDNDGEFGWTIPSAIATGYYRIRVKTVDNAVYDDSEVFRITTLASAYMPGKTVTKLGRPDHLQQKVIPDFYIAKMTMSPSSPIVFHNSTFSAVIKNTTPTSTIRAYAELKITCPFTKEVCYKFIIPPLQSGKSYRHTMPLILYKAGPYENKLTIDTSDVVKNEIETNNTGSWKYQVKPLMINSTPKNLEVLLGGYTGNKDFENHGPRVIFSAEIYISRDRKKIVMKYDMWAFEEGGDHEEARAKGERVLYGLYQGNKGYIYSFAGGYTKMVYRYGFTFGKRKDGPIVSMGMWGPQINPGAGTTGNGKVNPIKEIYFMGNRQGDDKGYSGFTIFFNNIDIELDGWRNYNPY